jgi:hypothetical protein
VEDLIWLWPTTEVLDIKTPIFTQFPVSRFVCSVPSSSDITFVSTAELAGDHSMTLKKTHSMV